MCLGTPGAKQGRCSSEARHSRNRSDLALSLPSSPRMPPSPGLTCPGAHSTHHATSYAKAEPPPGKKHSRLLPPPLHPQKKARAVSSAPGLQVNQLAGPTCRRLPCPSPFAGEQDTAECSHIPRQRRHSWDVVTTTCTAPYTGPTYLPDKSRPSATTGVTTPPASHEQSQRINARLTSPRQPIWALTVPW